jgi:hypothetical protein
VAAVTALADAVVVPVVVPVVVVPVVEVVLVVVPVEPLPGSVHAHATPPPAASENTDAATAIAVRCFLIMRGLLGRLPIDRSPVGELTETT